MTFNWKAGLFRIWVVLSFVWALVSFLAGLPRLALGVPLAVGAVLYMSVWIVHGFRMKDRPADTQFFDLRAFREELIRTQAPDLYKNKVEPLLNFLHAKYASNRIPMIELRALQQFAHDEVLLTRKERQRIIDEAAAQGKTIPMESIRQAVEQWIASYDKPDRAAVIEHVDHQLKLLTAKYGPAVPVDEAYKLQQAYEANSIDWN